MRVAAPIASSFVIHLMGLAATVSIFKKSKQYFFQSKYFLASFLLCGSAAIDIRFKKAAVLCISFDDRIRPGHGQLEWLLTPGVLKRVR